MIFDSITVAEGSNIKNMVVDSGGVFPSLADIGEFYYRTTDNTLHIYTPSGWSNLMSSSGSSSFTLGSTSVSSGATTSLAGLNTVSALSFIGDLTGTASLATRATNIAGGSVGYLPYQSNPNETSLIVPGETGYVLTSNGPLAAPSWQVSGAAATSVTIGSTTIAGGGTTPSLAGLTSVTSSAFVGTLTTGAQPNISSVGILNSLAVTGSITQNSGLSVGYLGIPQNTQGTYTCVLSDAGKHIFSASGGLTWTIPANASVAYPIGTALTFVNQGVGTCTIACGDTMYLVGVGTTGSRSLSAYGLATAIKTTATTWMISGNTLT
jgi:hypothetical protein